MNQSTKKIAYIQAGWHKEIVEQAYRSFSQSLKDGGINENQIDVYNVPGSLEIPLQAQYLARSGQYDIIVCCGLIVNGGIYRHEFVTTAVIDGMMRVMLDTGVPVLSVVLTPQNFHESEEHQNFFFNHFLVKGKEAASAALMTLKNMEQFQDLKKAA